MIDSTIVRAHQQSWGAKGGSDHCEAMGRIKGGFSTKIHTTVDASGNPLSFYLTPAEAHHLDGADKLLAELVADSVLAEKAYHAQERVIEQEEGNTAQR